MSATVTTPAGPEEPKDAVPAGYESEASPADQDAETVPAAPAWRTRLEGLRADDSPIRAHLQRAATNTRAWLAAANVTDGQLVEEITEQRNRTHHSRETELRRQLARISEEIIAAKRAETAHGDRNDPLRDGPAVVALKGRRELVEAQLREHQLGAESLALPPSEGEVARARWGRKLGRATALVGSVVGGGVIAPMHDPRVLLMSLPAAAVALWRAGLRVDDNGQTMPQTASAALHLEVPQSVPTEPAVADGTPVTVQDLVQPTSPEGELSTVEAASREWLMERLIEASIVTAESSKKAKVVSMVVQGPGWTATVQLPPGKKATDAIAKSGELASALGRKASQIETAVDTSEEGHEGRFTMWVSDKANPYGGPAVRSVLVDAEHWDFWEDGVPLGADARGVRKILHLLWSSLMVGGLQRYGKTYFARLVAAAAALDPYVRIVLISGKPSPDWLALRKVADKWVVGNTPAKVREAYDTITWLTDDLQQRGEGLTALAEKDPLKVPEGKVTRELSKTKEFGLTLLVVDELQNLLVAAQSVKSGTRPNDPAYASMIRDALTVFNRMTASQGGMALAVVHRPGPDSPVTPDLRDAFAARASYRVKGIDSARNMLGNDAVRDGAAPHALLEVHKGVAVVDLGEDGGHFTIKADVITLEEFAAICTRGRMLRQEAGTLTGYAAESADAEQADTDRRSLLTAVVDAIRATGGEGGRLEDLAGALADSHPGRWADLTPARLGELLREAGAGNTVKLPRQEDGSRPNGYRLDTLQQLLQRGSTTG